MNSKCLNCGYERKHSDIRHKSECPKCGKLYSTAKQKKPPQNGRKKTEPRHSRNSYYKNQNIQHDLLKEIRLLIRSRYGLIWIKTIDEARMESLLKYLADSMNLPFFVWTPSKGLKRFDLDNSVYCTNDPKQALGHIEHSLLPDKKTREDIFKTHLERRGHDPLSFDLLSMAHTTDGFSGAEIEQVTVSSLYTSFSNDSPLTTAILIEESENTLPLSKTRAEHIHSLREWAKDRTVSAQ